MHCYTAPENFYRTPQGEITTEPGEGHELVAGCGAVMSQAEARERGLPVPEPAPEEAPAPADSKPAPKSKNKPAAEPEAPAS